MTDEATWLGSMPEIYDRCVGPALFEPYAQHVARMVADLAPQDVLELAAGTGRVTRALVRALPDATITATDLNPAMVEWGAAHVPDATWRAADAQDLPFPGDTFDVAVCQFGVMFFPDRPGAFAQAARVLRPGATMVFAVWDTVEANELARYVVAALTDILGDQVSDWLQRVPYGYHDADQIRSDTTAGGLDVVSIDRVGLRGRADAAATAEGFCCGTPLRFDLAAAGDLDAITARVTAHLAERLGDAPIDADLCAYVVAARRPS